MKVESGYRRCNGGWICIYIFRHPDTWKDEIARKNIRMSEEVRDGHRYVIFNYYNDADFTDPVVQEARGIIIDTDVLEVRCWPFRKFGNFMESYADPIDWKSAKVQDKKDGSICKLWFDPLLQKWRWSTNACIDAANANLEYQAVGVRSYRDAIERAENYPDLQKSITAGKLDPVNTYIFELVGPYNRVVIHYPKTSLWHIGTRNNRTGEESNTDIGIHHPLEYPLHTLKECINAAVSLNRSSNHVIKEGFVVVDKDWHRIKIKCPAYLVLHHAVMSRITKQEAVEFLLSGGSFDDVKSMENKTIIKYYDYRMAELEMQVQRYIDYVRGLAEELAYDRKAIAAVIKNDKFSDFGFRCLRSEEVTAGELLFTFKSPHDEAHLLKLLPDYKET